MISALALCVVASTALAQVPPAEEPVADAGTPGSAAVEPEKPAQPAKPAELLTRSAPSPAPDAFVVRNFEANQVALEHAPGLTQLMATRLGEAKLKAVTEDDIQKSLGLERQRVLMGSCTSETECAAELADAMGARYIVSGRIDRFSERYLVSATIWDQARTEVKVKSQREVTDAGLLPAAMQEIADELLAPFGVPPKVGVKLADRVQPLGFNLGLKLGSTLITSFARFAPAGEIELAFRINHAWLLFVQIGFGLAFDVTTQTNVGLTPGLLGLRYHFRSDKDLQPTVGGGLGVITTINAAQGKSRLSLNFNLGVLYLITQRVSAALEASMDLLGLAYSVAEKTSALTGVNLNLSLGVNYRF